MNHPLNSRLSEYIRQLLNRLLSLLIVFLLLAATAVWTGNLFGRKIGTSTADNHQQKVLAELPGTDVLKVLHINQDKVKLIPRDSASWTVQTADSPQNLGIIINSMPYARDITGFAGPTPIYIYVNTAEKIEACAIGDNAETPYFIQRVAEGILPQWTGKTPEEALALKVDAVSGATYSSKAVISHTQATLQAQTASIHTQTPEPAIGWTRTIALAVVLLIGIVIARFFKGNKWLRTLVLILNVGVTGFWCGQFLSLSLFRGWLANGMDPVLYLPTLLMLSIALLLPFAGFRRHHCTWVCPFGSIQELAWRMPFPKIHCSARTFRIMSRLRMYILAALLLALWTGTGAWILDYEPFTAFAFSSATPVVMVLAGLFVAASCFVPNVWCKACCPVGALLDLTEN